MTPFDDSPDEMRGLFLDEGTADRLLAGRVDPDDAPPGYAEVARLLRAAGAPPTSRELAREEHAVAMAARVVGAPPAGTPTPARRRSTVRSRFSRAKVAGLIVAGTLVGTTGLAAAGVLPDAAQNAASTVLSKIGISVPAAQPQPDTLHPASTGATISHLATTTTATGVQKGALISSVASGGKSRAGQNGASAANVGGTGTANAASGGASDHGAATADQASQGHSAAGSGNGKGTHSPAP